MSGPETPHHISLIHSTFVFADGLLRAGYCLTTRQPISLVKSCPFSCKEGCVFEDGHVEVSDIERKNSYIIKSFKCYIEDTGQEEHFQRYLHFRKSNISLVRVLSYEKTCRNSLSTLIVKKDFENRIFK